MKLVPKGMAGYGILVVLLFMIAAIAARETISNIQELVNDANSGRVISDELLERVVTWPVLALTGGLLFLAGALGIWMIRSVAIRESRMRVGRFVDAMDYLKDGVVVLDRRARIVGMNPAAHALAAGEGAGPLRKAFPFLRESDEEILMDPLSPQEVETVAPSEKGLRALRFRSQPHEDMSLLLISDITGLKAAEMRTRQSARLQLVGRIANGVAHDFSNILCAISGFASLLERQRAVLPAGEEAFRALVRETQKGGAVANRLLDLCRVHAGGAPCAQIKERVHEAVELLRAALPPDWRLVADVKGPFDATALTDAQLQQVVVSAGMCAADEQGVPGLLHIRVRSPKSDASLASNPSVSSVVLVGAFGSDETFHGDETAASAETLVAEDVGVVQSVLRAVLEEVGGRFDFIKTPAGKHMYRMTLPRAAGASYSMGAWAAVSEEVRTRISGWRVLMGYGRREDALRAIRLFQDLGMNVELATDIVAVLQHVEADRGLKGIVVERALLGEEGPALLRAIRKLRPRTGIVVLDAHVQAPSDLAEHVVFEMPDVAPDRLLDSLVKAEEMAANWLKQASRAT
jgi:signal transduction histidine kinase/CheY-like chemotaxis protein